MFLDTEYVWIAMAMEEMAKCLCWTRWFFTAIAGVAATAASTT